MTSTQFTPLASLGGGALIGLAAVILMALNGRIAGCSGILSTLLAPGARGSAGPAVFAVGMVLTPLIYIAAAGSSPAIAIDSSPAMLIAAGLLVGFGSVWGGGCTSGHGVCGLARLSPRSLAATCVFMAFAIAAVFITRHML